MKARNFVRNAAAATVTAGLLTAGTVVLASPASAVGTSACTRFSVPDDVFGKRHSAAIGLVNVDGLNLRNGPGVNYYSKGHLYETKSTMRIVCTAKGDSWLYGRVDYGPNHGKWGWVSRRYISLYPY